MDSYEKIDLETYRGDDYFLAGIVKPKPCEGEDYDPDEDADKYGIVLGRSTDGSNTQIVRLDTEHGTPHIDKEYLPHDSDENQKEWLEEGYEYSRMKAYLQTYWKEYVDLYIYYNE